MSVSIFPAYGLIALLISAASPAFSMDVARVEARVDAAITRFGVTGRGVIVATLDRGIDWRNDDFCNDDGTTRIKWIFDLTDNTGAFANGNIYGKGTIYSEAQINAALVNNTSLATRDAVGHGTTTAAIAAGNGRGLANRKYRGVAPGATLIIVKVVGGASAHDTEPAEANFYDEASTLTGMDFIRDKARALMMPCVMIPNLGSIGGPTDGTSEFARKINSIVEPGLLVVNGPGDEGGIANRVTGQVAQGETASLQITKAQTGDLRIDLWYQGTDRFNVTLVTPGGAFGPYAAPANGAGSTESQTGQFTLNHRGANSVFYGATNGKREVLVDISGPIGTYTLKLIGVTIAGDGRFDGGMNPANVGQPAGNRNAFLSHIFPGNQGNIWDGATALLNICSGDYVIRTNWTDVDGFARSFTSQGSVGGIWTGSSAGPTYDGRLGVDLCAPGDSVFTTYAPKSFWATSRGNMIQDGVGRYGRASAVSAAAPFAVGVVALMLQLNPRLDAATVKQILQSSARADAFTGAVPNAQWGHGKIDAVNALSLTANTLLRYTQIQKSAASFRLSFTSVVGKNYRIEHSNTLTDNPTWMPLTSFENVTGTGATIEVIDSDPTLTRRFYRVVPLP